MSILRNSTVAGRLVSLVRIAMLALLVAGCSGDGREPGSLSIGRQVWTSGNLDVDRYRNGDAIREAASVAEWNDAIAKGEGAWCRYGDARLYNWHAVVDPRGLAPEGWHVPSDVEWSELESATGGRGFALSGYPGSRNCLGNFFGQGSMAFFWTTTPSGGFDAWNREAAAGGTKLRRVSVGKGLGLSVRCVKDNG